MVPRYPSERRSVGEFALEKLAFRSLARPQAAFCGTTWAVTELSDIHFSGATKIILVPDNLSTHKPALLDEAFPAAEARRLVERFEWHDTPKHGSWLDMAEAELGVLTSQCLDRRIADKQTLIEEVDAWEKVRNKKHTKADWQFTTANARVKLKRLYPSI